MTTLLLLTILMAEDYLQVMCLRLKVFCYILQQKTRSASKLKVQDCLCMVINGLLSVVSKFNSLNKCWTNTRCYFLFLNPCKCRLMSSELFYILGSTSLEILLCLPNKYEFDLIHPTYYFVFSQRTALLTRWVSYVEQYLYTLQEHICHPRILVEIVSHHFSLFLYN